MVGVGKYTSHMHPRKKKGIPNSSAHGVFLNFRLSSLV